MLLTGFALAGLPFISDAAAAPRLIGNYDYWQMVVFFDGNHRSCAINNQAIKPTAGKQKKSKQKNNANDSALPNADNVGNAYFFITNWPKRKEYLALSGRSHSLLNDKRSGWLIFPDDSRFPLIQSKLYVRPQAKNRVQILRRLREHDNLQMINYNENDQEIRMNFNLKGLDAALAALVKTLPATALTAVADDKNSCPIM